MWQALSGSKSSRRNVDFLELSSWLSKSSTVKIGEKRLPAPIDNLKEGHLAYQKSFGVGLKMCVGLVFFRNDRSSYERSP